MQTGRFKHVPTNIHYSMLTSISIVYLTSLYSSHYSSSMKSSHTIILIVHLLLYRPNACPNATFSNLTSQFTRYGHMDTYGCRTKLTLMKTVAEVTNQFEKSVRLKLQLF